MDADERQQELDHLLERRNILVHRRRLLERQRDMLGVDAPTHITVEIDQANHEIELIEGRIRVLSLDPQILADVGEMGVWAALQLRVERLERDVRKMAADFLAELAADREERIARWAQQEVDRRRGQRKYLWAAWVAVAAQLLMLAGVGWIVWRLLGEPLLARW